jgi:hypothetical protein
VSGLAKLTRFPQINCVGKQVYYLGPMPRMFDYPRDCSHNEVQGVCGRVLADVPPCSGAEILWPYYKRWSVLAALHACPVTLEDFRNVYKGLKRIVYERVFSTINDITGPFNKTKGFVKIQKRDTYYKWISDPRVIMYKLKECNLMLRPFVTALEHAMYNHTVNGLRLFAKGRNLLQRAADILAICLSFKRFVCIATDCARFDLHTREEFKQHEARLLREEGVYRSLWESVLEAFVRMVFGTAFRTFARLSGEMMTAFGNCAASSAIVDAFFAQYPDIRYHYYCDGDDCLVFVEYDDQWVLELLPAWYMRFGHEMRVDKRAERFEDIEFCQTMPIPFQEGYCMVRDPRKTLATLLCTKLPPTSVNAAYFATLAECMLHCNNGVPMVTTLCERMMTLSKKRVEVREDFLFLARQIKINPTAYTVSACIEAFGLDFAMIHAYERAYSKINIIGRVYRDLPNPTIQPWDCSVDGVSLFMETTSAQATQVGSGIPVM